jgi:DNA helicase-2/ATP-dependent DNA helicase PcrA
MIRNTPSQEAIINTAKRRVEVKAEPGSGKTHTLTGRLLRLIDTGVAPQKILVLGFSNATVNQLHKRIESLSRQRTTSDSAQSIATECRTDLSAVEIQTVHAYARSTSRKTQADVKLLTEKAAKALLLEAIVSVQRDARKCVLWSELSSDIRQRRLELLATLAGTQYASAILNFFAFVQTSGKSLSEAASLSQFKEFRPAVKLLSVVSCRFSAIKQKRHLIDFGDMLARASMAIDDGASVPFTHILVDEYQDCSPAQAHLLEQLARLKGRSIMVFGDPNQAIFGFSGASYTPLSSFLNGVTQFSLPESQRLTAKTAALASAIAQHADVDAIRTLRDGAQPVLFMDISLKTQTERIVRDIRQLIAAGTPPKNIAVLARIKALLAPIEQSLLAEKVQTHRIGKRRDRVHALRALRLVRVVERCEKTKTRVTPEMLRAAVPRVSAPDSQWKNSSLKINKVSRTPSLEGRYRQCAQAYLCLMGGVRADKDIQHDVNRWEPSCRSYANAQQMMDAIRGLDSKLVTTGTIHSAKGGEWNHVLIVGATDGLLPLYLARDKTSRGEERRLLFVAVTRAREAVRMYHAPSNHANSRRRFNEPSRFLVKSAARATLRVINAQRSPADRKPIGPP